MTVGNAGHAPCHVLDVKSVAARFQVVPERGLSTTEIADRRARHGANVIEEKGRRGVPHMLLAQFADFMIIVLLGAAFVAALVGDAKDSLVIILIVVLNAIVGFIQDFRAERAMAALRLLVPAMTVVIRDGQHHAIRAADIVPGDVVALEAGNIVPADLRLVEVTQLRLSEAALTGESVPIDKQIELIEEPLAPVADRTNMAFKGTLVTYGRGRGIAVATGMNTELGKLAGLLGAGPDTRTPLQQRLALFGRQLALAVMAICAIIFAVGLMRGEPALLMFLVAVSLAVAAIPEALPATITVSLALGARNMAAKAALIRRLPAVEALGSVTYICADKTGTLTLNDMRVERLLSSDGTPWRAGQHATSEPWPSLFKAIALNSDARMGEGGSFLGDPTEVALHRAAAESGFDRRVLEAATPRIAEIPFDSHRKRMTTCHPDRAGFLAYTKGAPESVVPCCVDLLTPNGPRDIEKEAMLALAERMADDGLRVLAFAQRHLTESPRSMDSAEVESGLTLLGFVGLIDPPRPQVEQAVRACKSAGITPVMITGDHSATAGAIARRLGIADHGDETLTGPELARLSDSAFAARVTQIRVYARVDPAQKIRIVEALQRRGECVAMTGDGVNDAPALKQANIGVAMGERGTDVAREASGLVLLDDNFATIVAAVREGRRIYDNIRKVVKYIMAGNSAEIWTIFLAPFLGLPIPLLPIHILWVNLVTDGLPALALAFEAADEDIMKRRPRPPNESMFAGRMWQHMTWVGLLTGAVSLLAQAYAIQIGSANWRTMVFTVLTLSQMGHVLAIRSDRLSLFQQGLFSNAMLFGAVALVFMLQIAIIYVPALNVFFSTTPLQPGEFAVCLGLSAVVFAAVECEKWLVRKKETHDV